MAVASIELVTARVSVVVPMYNAVRYVGEALQSIMAQTVPMTEIIVVDDGSTDEGARVVESFPGITLVRKAHSGIGDTLNTGLARVSGNYIAFLDADDRWLPEKTKIQLQVLADEPGLDGVFGHAERFLMTPEGEVRLDVLPAVSKVGGLFRTAAFRRVGGFSTRVLDFIDWYARAMDEGLKFKVLDELVCQRRIHDANDGVVRREEQRTACLATLKAKLDRRRAKPPGT